MGFTEAMVQSAYDGAVDEFCDDNERKRIITPCADNVGDQLMAGKDLIFPLPPHVFYPILLLLLVLVSYPIARPHQPSVSHDIPRHAWACTFVCYR